MVKVPMVTLNAFATEDIFFAFSVPIALITCISFNVEKTVKKYETQVLKTDSGIEIKIPMKEYNDPSSVEFITEADGSVSVLIKKIGCLTARI